MLFTISESAYAQNSLSRPNYYFLVSDGDKLHSKTPIPSVTYLGRVTTQWLDSESVVTVVNCRQPGDYTVTEVTVLLAVDISD